MCVVGNGEIHGFVFKKVGGKRLLARPRLGWRMIFCIKCRTYVAARFSLCEMARVLLSSHTQHPLLCLASALKITFLVSVSVSCI